jgi:asparagine synthase (glutamine-hydrolysing)
MCGIAGFCRFDSEGAKGIDLVAATRAIAHRGPDDEGIWQGRHVGLGHRRLSIIDLSPLGHQPMVSASGRYQIVFNGEIYNFLELRRDLEKGGVVFRGNSDTESLVNGYECWGKDLFARLNGIFAFAIWDTREEKLIAVRDRMGVKPFNYRYDRGTFAFGSEIKAILHLGSASRKLDAQGFHEFLYYGNALGENTLFAGVKKLLPGEWLEVSREGLRFGSYWKHEDIQLQPVTSASESAAIDSTRRLLEQAVQRQLVGDVPVGVFLSGGIDSSAITAFATRNSPNSLDTWSAGFDFDDGHNELPMAARVAKTFGTRHHELRIQGNELPDVIRRMVQQHDEPFGDAANIPLYLMTREIRDSCKVILQGDGGDELFGGYNRYHLLKRQSRYAGVLKFLNLIPKAMLPGRLRNQIRRFHSVFSTRDRGTRLARFLTIEESGDRGPERLLARSMQLLIRETSPSRRYEALARRFQSLDDVQQLFWLDSLIILPDQFLEKVDKSTMANGVEVRVPFLDNDLAEFALGLPSGLKVYGGEKKYLLKKAVRGIVPDEVLDAPKKGFGVPYYNWIKGPLKSFMMDIFNSPAIRKRELLAGDVLKCRIDDHCAGRDDWGFQLWKLMNFCLWVEMYDIDTGPAGN